MSTMALLGLLVVLLVAIGIAGFLLRGRRGARRPDPAATPRTVGELVERRRAGMDEPQGAAGADGVADLDDADTDAIAQQRGSASTAAAPPSADDSSTVPTPDAGVSSSDAPSDRSGPTAAAAAGAAGGAVVSGRGAGADDRAGSAATGVDDTAAAAGTAASAASTTSTASTPSTGSTTAERPDGDASAGPTPSPRPRPGSDADTGPASAPWSRGFVGGRQITPPAPEPTRGSPSAGAPSPTPRRAVSTSPAEGGATSTSEGPGGTAAAGGAAASATSTGENATPATSAAARAEAPTSADDAGSGAAAEPARPSAPPRQQSQSPVDPDLVKRVTAVPSGGKRTGGPDTEREFREARDRMAGAAGSRSGRVPEQSSRSPETGESNAPAASTPSASPRPSPSPRATSEEGTGAGAASAVGAAGLAAVTASVLTSRSGSDDEGDAGVDDPTLTDRPEQASTPGVARPSPGPRAGAAGGSTPAGDEPPPRPTPRVMRSSAPATGGPDDDVSDRDDKPTGPTVTGPTATGVAAGSTIGDVTTAAGATSAGSTTAGSTTAGAGEAGASSAGTSVTEASGTGTDLAEASGSVVDSVGTTGSGRDGDVTTASATSSTTEAPTTASPAPVAERAVTGPRPAIGEEPAPVVAFSSPSTARREPVTSSPAQDVEVQVADRNARPLPGVTLSMVDGSGTPAGSASTGAAGEARLRAPGAGQYVLVASASGYQTGVAPCAVADESVRVAVTLTRSSAVHGAVRSASGGARSGVPVVLEQDGETLGRATTGGDGTFRFADLDAGHYRLVAGDGPGVTVNVRPEADVEQNLEEAAAVTGNRT